MIKKEILKRDVAVYVLLMAFESRVQIKNTFSIFLKMQNFVCKKFYFRDKIFLKNSLNILIFAKITSFYCFREFFKLFFLQKQKQ